VLAPNRKRLLLFIQSVYRAAGRRRIVASLLVKRDERDSRRRRRLGGESAPTGHDLGETTELAQSSTEECGNESKLYVDV